MFDSLVSPNAGGPARLVSMRNWGQIIGLSMLLTVMFVSSALAVDASQLSETYLRGRVTAITEEGSQEVAGQTLPWQVVEVEITTDPEKGKQVTIEHGKRFSLRDEQKVRVGQKVVIRKVTTDSGENYEILDSYRTEGIAVFAVGVALLVLLLTGKRGAAALASLGVTYWLLVAWIVPKIIGGASPLLMSLVGALVIATVSMYLTHGWRRETGVALSAILMSVLVAALLAARGVALGQLFGLGSEEAYAFQFGPYASLDFRGLLLAGMIFGALGVLDDIATAQVATVEELKRANPNLSTGELYRRGMAVGRVHIASLVNTLVLAYAGASFPLFLALVIGGNQPLWVTINSEFLAEEIVRTLVGSASLLLAVPIATWLAASYFAKQKM